jgi:hypothetical protein
MSRGLKLAVALVHPYILSHHPPFSPYLLPCALKKKEGQKDKRAKKKENRKKIPGS